MAWKRAGWSRRWPRAGFVDAPVAPHGRNAARLPPARRFRPWNACPMAGVCRSASTQRGPPPWSRGAGMPCSCCRRWSRCLPAWRRRCAGAGRSWSGSAPPSSTCSGSGPVPAADRCAAGAVPVAGRLAALAQCRHGIPRIAWAGKGAGCRRSPPPRIGAGAAHLSGIEVVPAPRRLPPGQRARGRPPSSPPCSPALPREAAGPRRHRSTSMPASAP